MPTQAREAILLWSYTRVSKPGKCSLLCQTGVRLSTPRRTRSARRTSLETPPQVNAYRGVRIEELSKIHARYMSRSHVDPQGSKESATASHPFPHEDAPSLVRRIPGRGAQAEINATRSRFPSRRSPLCTHAARRGAPGAVQRQGHACWAEYQPTATDPPSSKRYGLLERLLARGSTWSPPERASPRSLEGHPPVSSYGARSLRSLSAWSAGGLPILGALGRFSARHTSPSLFPAPYRGEALF